MPGLTKQTFVQSSALSNHHPPLSSGKPTRAFDYAAPTSDNGGTIASYKMTPKIVRQNGNGGNQSSKAMRIDVQQIMRHFSSNHWIKDKLRSLLQNEIPVQILLAKDHTNEKVQVPVEFWEELGESLDSKKSVTFTIVEDLMNHDVCEKNKHRTQTLLPMLLGTKGNPGTALNQKEFVNLVASELQALWTDLEGWTKSAIHSQLYQWKKEKARMALSGDQTKDAISFIEQRLLVELVHQAKTIYYYCRFGRMNRIRDRPIQSKSAFQTDFALYNSGGRILPHLTSPYYHRCKPTPLFGRFFGLQKLIPRPFSQELSNQLATRAIQTGLQPGDCWPMLGNYGQISIWLTRRIIVTAVTIEHVDVRLSLDLKSAPREMEIWRLAAPIESIFQKSSSWSWPHSRPVRDDTYKKHDAMKDKKSSILGTWYKQGSPTFGASLLTTITYQRQHQWNMSDDPTEETETIDIEAAQLFSIPPLRQNVPSYGVMIRILSNWGHPDFTCLYRIHVHGFEA
ncbi:hypothetical protein FBU30_003128 [Linnemannia zychae]|nr:hypothetical protein FBU30_003128 [Linnemannia zychae]